jgi:hypothetical protein
VRRHPRPAPMRFLLIYARCKISLPNLTRGTRHDYGTQRHGRTERHLLPHVRRSGRFGGVGCTKSCTKRCTNRCFVPILHHDFRLWCGWWFLVQPWFLVQCGGDDSYIPHLSPKFRVIVQNVVRVEMLRRPLLPLSVRMPSESIQSLGLAQSKTCHRLRGCSFY